MRRIAADFLEERGLAAAAAALRRPRRKHQGIRREDGGVTDNRRSRGLGDGEGDRLMHYGIAWSDMAEPPVGYGGLGIGGTEDDGDCLGSSGPDVAGYGWGRGECV